MKQRICLYVVSLPIGNLDDITIRALKTLNECSYILCEDTRHTKILLDHHKINTKTISYRDQNHNRVINFIENEINNEKTFAIVSDAGTPILSDPGYLLIRKAYQMGWGVSVIPGASSITSAISSTPIPSDKFSFIGFLPKTPAKRKEILKNFGALDSALIIFESPNRIHKLLNEISESLGNRYIALCSEITKIHESVNVAKVDDLIMNLPQKLKGEYVVIVGKSDIVLDLYVPNKHQNP